MAERFPLFALLGFAVFLGLLFLLLSRDASLKRVVRVVASVLVACLVFSVLVLSAEDFAGALLGAIVSVGAGYVLHWRTRFCQGCGTSDILEVLRFLPPSRETPCRFCGGSVR